MDVYSWASRLHSSNHHSEGEDDARAYIPCPFCYVEIEVPVLCCHLQEEHCFDLKNAVCPLCAANLGKDVTGHFLVQHAQSVKRRRKPQKSGFRDSSAVVGKDLRELSSTHGSSLLTNSRVNVHESSLDPLLAPFLCSLPLLDPRGNQQDEYYSDAISITSSAESDALNDVKQQEEDDEVKRQKAVFFQQLIMSIIF